MENLKLKVKSCALCPFRMQLGVLEIKENCMIQATKEGEEPRELEYSISPLGRDKNCPLPLKVRFEI